MGKGEERPQKRGRRTVKTPEREIPHIVIFAIYAFLALIFWRAVVLPGQVLNSADQISPAQIFRQYEAWAVKTLHRLPFWNPYIFSGIPFLAGQHTNPFYPTSVMRWILPPYINLNWNFIIHTFLAGVLMYLLLLSLRIKRSIAFIFGVSYMYAGTITSLSLSGHDTKVMVASLLPGFFYTLIKGSETLKVFWFILGGILLGFGVLAGHLQMMYFAYLAVGITFIYLLFRIWSTTRDPGRVFKFFGLSLLALLISVLIGFVQYFPALDYIRNFSPRGGAGKGYEFATSWSLPPVDLISAFFAKFSGFRDATANTYWGHYPFKINSEYIGAIPLPFAIWAVWRYWKKGYVKIFTVLAIVYILIALGGYTPFYMLVYYLLPGAKAFRAAAMNFYVAAFAINVLAAYGLSQLRMEDWWRFSRYTLIFAGVCFIFMILAYLMRDSLSFMAAKDKIQVFQQYFDQIPLAFLRTGVLVILAFFLLYLWIRGDLKSHIFSGILALIIPFDLYTINNRFVATTSSPEVIYEPDGVTQFVKQDTTVFRVLPLLYRIDEDYLMEHHIESAGGHHPFPSKSYLDLIGTEGSVMFRPYRIHNLVGKKKIVDLLNIKYIVTMPLEILDPATRRVLLPIKNLLEDTTLQFIGRFRYNGKYCDIYLNKTPLPRATLFSNYKVLPHDEALRFILSDEFDPREVVILEENPEIEGNMGTEGKVRIVKRLPDLVKLEVETNGPMILLYTDNYYSRWKAELEDGSQLPVMRADYTFRAIPVPKGKHRIRMYYDGSVEKMSMLLSILAFSLSIVGLVVSRFISK
jgi:hypothetical protein